MGRAWGILTGARIISSREVLDRISDLRLGMDLGMVKGMKHDVMAEIITCSQPAHLQKLANRHLEIPERDRRRADLIRGILSAKSGT